jgi:hypothetical protein
VPEHANRFDSVTKLDESQVAMVATVEPIKTLMGSVAQEKTEDRCRFRLELPQVARVINQKLIISFDSFQV